MVYSEALVNQLNNKIAHLNKEIELYRMQDRDLANMIDPRTFANALSELGWHELPDNGFNAIILQTKEKGELYQVNIPKGKHLGDFVFTMRYAAREVARWLEKDNGKQVLVDMVIATNKSNLSSSGGTK